MSGATDVRGNRISPITATQAALERIRAVDPAIGSFLTVAEESALARAAVLDRQGPAGAGPLWGVPFSVKDVLDTAGVRTTYGSRQFADHVPTADAPPVERLLRAGGVLVGKTNTPEFAIYIRTVNDLRPETRNPWDPSRTCGGSSGGAAASVAAGLTTMTLGSDGGGSVRIPAAFCGVVGLKPSRGSIPSGGGFIGTRRFSTAGPLALRVEDARTMWRVMRGAHPGDRSSRTHVDQDRVRRTTTTGVRMRWLSTSGFGGEDPDVLRAVRSAVEQLALLDGVEIDDSTRSLESPRFAEPFYDAMMADRLATGGRQMMADPLARSRLTTYARHHFERAEAVTGARYSDAVQRGDEAADHVDGLLTDVDFLVTPTVGSTAPPIPLSEELSLPEDARRAIVAFTFLMNYSGHAAISVPCGTVGGLPVALQIVGRPGAEERLFDVAALVQDHVYPPTGAAQPGSAAR